jgi:Xaa-Pro dipeptidase
MFGSAELSSMTETGPRHAEVESKVALVRGLIDRRGLDAAVLSGADAVAWLTGGVTNRIESGHPASPLWIVVTADRVAAATTNVEGPRLAAEAGLEFELHETAWYEPGGLARAAEELAAATAQRVGGLGVDIDDDLVELRLALLPSERERLAALAVDAAAALEEAVRAWQPGERDVDVQACVAERLERAGAFGACLIVGGDERVERFRHPLAAGVPVRRLVMAVVVAERQGLHAAATRFACAGGLSESVRQARAASLAVEQATLAACLTGATYGDAVDAFVDAYAGQGAPDEWRDHYQGGPVGYRQREFEPVPGSRWLGTPIDVGHALAWNPSFAGGGKSEDTYLVEPGGLRRLTDTRAWPVGPDGRPAILDVATGAAA